MERQSKWASARGSPVCQHMALPPTRKVSSDITSSQCHLGLTMSQVQQILFPSCYLNNKKKTTAIIPGVRRARSPPLSPNPLRAHTLKQMAQERCWPNQLFTQL